jgi:hypothetical protein
MLIRDESNQKRAKQAQHHRRWHASMSANDKLVLFAPVEHGKTSTAVARVLWEIGRNPLLRCAYISLATKQAEKFLGAVRHYIEFSPDYRLIFPHVRKTDRQDEPWTQRAITVHRPYGVRDPTVQALGVGSPIQGARLDLVIVDDVLDFETTRTPDQRSKTLEWLKSKVINRILWGGKIIFIGTPWHPQDAMHVLQREGWPTIRESAYREDGTPLWPAKWWPDRLTERRRILGPRVFSRQFLCLARDDAESRFKQEWIDKCKERGRGKMLLTRYEGTLPVVTGVDLAVQQGEHNDQTVIFTAVLHPDGSRQPIDIRSGRWTAPDICKNILDSHIRYRSQLVLVENNAAQDYVRQWLKSQTTVPVRGYTTGRSKAHPEFGVEAIAVEMENAKWIIPCDKETGQCAPEIEAWIEECLNYTPSAHTGDRLMASFFVREASRQVGAVGVVENFGNLMFR